MNFNSALLLNEIIKFFLQLIIISILGGAVSWFYSKQQKNREMRTQILREFSEIHGQFIALRYEYNSFHVKWQGKRSVVYRLLNDSQVDTEKWGCYQRACSLIGKFQGLKPLLHENFQECADDIEFIFSKYQDWRRRIRVDKPILQHFDGKNEEGYNDLRYRYSQAVKCMRKKI